MKHSLEPAQLWLSPHFLARNQFEFAWGQDGDKEACREIVWKSEINNIRQMLVATSHVHMSNVKVLKRDIIKWNLIKIILFNFNWLLHEYHVFLSASTPWFAWQNLLAKIIKYNLDLRMFLDNKDYLSDGKFKNIFLGWETVFMMNFATNKCFPHKCLLWSLVN